MAEQRFKEHFDTLIALVTHLSSTHLKSRTPSNIAKSLGLDPAEVLKVLQLFPGFFRRSKDQEGGEYYYTVHLRYARRKQGDPSESLSPEELSSLFDLITQMTSHEHESSLLSVEIKEAQKGIQQTTRITVIVAIMSALTAIIAAVIAVAFQK